MVTDYLTKELTTGSITDHITFTSARNELRVSHTNYRWLYGQTQQNSDKYNDERAAEHN